MGKLDSAWLAAFIHDECGLAKDKLALALKFDEDALRHMLSFLISGSLSIKPTAECIVKLVAKRMLQARMEQVGGRAEKIRTNAKEFVLPTGKLHWRACAAYILQWTEQRAIVVVHAPSGDEVTIPNHCVITTELELHANYSDTNAMCVGPLEGVLEGLLREGQGAAQGSGLEAEGRGRAGQAAPRRVRRATGGDDWRERARGLLFDRDSGGG